MPHCAVKLRPCPRKWRDRGQAGRLQSQSGGGANRDQGRRSARRKHESDIKDQQEKISKYRDQSLKVKTNQEYKALLSEIEHAEAEIAKLEDKILEIMVAADARKEGLKQAEATLKADTAANEKEKEHARQQTAEDEKQLAELDGATQ